MKKSKFLYSLPFKLLVSVALGMGFGLLLNFNSESAFTTAALNVIVTLKYILGQLINFCVPLIIIGFIAPSITQLGNNASRMLGIAVFIAYFSSLGAALFSTAAGYLLIPHLSIRSSADSLRSLPDVIFQLSIPQIMPVMSALVLAVMLGLASAWTKAQLMTSLLKEFQNIVLSLVSRILIPILPLFIGLTFCSLAYEGTITRQLPVFLKVIVIVLLGHFIWLFLLYTAAGIYARENPLKVIRHYGPAYLTAIGTMSSAATLAVALQCAGKAKPLRKDMIQFGIPLFANIHLCADRSFFLHDNFQNPVWCCTGARDYGSFLHSSGSFCHRCSRSSRWNCHGLSRTSHRYTEIRRLRHCFNAHDLCTSGQLRNCLQYYWRRRTHSDSYRLCKETSY